MPTIEERALETAVEAVGRRMQDYRVMAEENILRRSIEAHARVIAEFEAFRREVSDAVEDYYGEYRRDRMHPLLSRFILPAPVDPLVEAVKDCGYATLDAIEKEFADDLRAALAKRGLKLVEVGDA